MRIEIAKKNTPFSKLPGSFVIIPKTKYGVRIFPTKLEFYDKNQKCLEVFLNLKGPVKNFSVFFNIEKEQIEVFGFSLDGFFRYRIFSQNQVKIVVDKSPPNFSFKINENPIVTKLLDLPLESSTKEIFNERLSLGVNKKEDVELISRRRDLKEILPLWFAIGKMVLKSPQKYENVASLLLKVEKEIQNNEKIKLEETLLNIYEAGFKSIFYPTLFDEKFQGIVEDMPASEDAHPFFLLEKGSELIRKMFFQRDDNILYILPCLLPSFHCGRMKNIKSCSLKLDFEWSKKLLKKLIIYSTEQIEIKLQLQREIKTFRIRMKKNEKGIFYKHGDFLELKPNVNYLIDCFNK